MPAELAEGFRWPPNILVTGYNTAVEHWMGSGRFWLLEDLI
jgi:hypothetical protein